MSGIGANLTLDHLSDTSFIEPENVDLRNPKTFQNQIDNDQEKVYEPNEQVWKRPRLNYLDGLSAQKRKEIPLYRGLMLYFPNALCAVANLSVVASKQHGHDEIHWDKSKSSDHYDCLLRHLLEAGNVDDDGVLHDVKVAWRALAHLETLLEKQ